MVLKLVEVILEVSVRVGVAVSDVHVISLIAKFYIECKRVVGCLIFFTVSKISNFVLLPSHGLWLPHPG